MTNFWKEIGQYPRNFKFRHRIDCSQWFDVCTQLMHDPILLIQTLDLYQSSDIWLVEEYLNCYVFYIQHVKFEVPTLVRTKIQFPRHLAVGNKEILDYLAKFKTEGVAFQYYFEFKQ